MHKQETLINKSRKKVATFPKKAREDIGTDGDGQLLLPQQIKLALKHLRCSRLEDETIFEQLAISLDLDIEGQAQ